MRYPSLLKGRPCLRKQPMSLQLTSGSGGRTFLKQPCGSTGGIRTRPCYPTAKAVAQLIKDGGYATSLSYVQNLCGIIERWNLTQYDSANAAEPTQIWYRVRKSWADAKSQKGAFHVLSNAKACADENPGYSVFDESGKAIYTGKSSGSQAPSSRIW